MNFIDCYKTLYSTFKYTLFHFENEVKVTGKSFLDQGIQEKVRELSCFVQKSYFFILGQILQESSCWYLIFPQLFTKTVPWFHLFWVPFLIFAPANQNLFDRFELKVQNFSQEDQAKVSEFKLRLLAKAGNPYPLVVLKP